MKNAAPSSPPQASRRRRRAALAAEPSPSRGIGRAPRRTDARPPRRPALARAGTDDDSADDTPAPPSTSKDGSKGGDDTDTFEDGDFSDVEGPGLDFRDDEVQGAVKPRGPGEDRAGRECVSMRLGRLPPPSLW